jgi:uncharacterized protein YjbI with pentapeptide repeats
MVEIRWDTCEESECFGARIEGEGRCLAHVDPAHLEAAVERMQAAGALEARGVRFSSELLERVLERYPVRSSTSDTGRFETGDVEFAGATFEDDVSFGQLTFTGRARFDGATFQRTASFWGASFVHSPVFDGATFEGDVLFAAPVGLKAAPTVVQHTVFNRRAQFANATFRGPTVFARCEFGDIARFEDANFERGVSFDGARFAGGTSFERTRIRMDPASPGSRFGHAAIANSERAAASFDGATFAADFSFESADVEGSTRFANAVFEQRAEFLDHVFHGDAIFDGATFRGLAGFGGTRFTGRASFVGTVFEGDAWFYDVEVTGDAHFREATFAHVANLANFRAWITPPTQAAESVALGGGIDLSEAVLHQPAELHLDADDIGCWRVRLLEGGQITVARGSIRLPATRFPQACTLASDRSQRASVTDLRGADTANLVLAGLDLARCRFADSINLDKLRLEADCTFGEPPRGIRWTRRQVIAEEYEWRTSPRGKGGAAWRGLLGLPGEEGGPLHPLRIAAIYRALRKGREEAKDEPGAADFYYGEMEMRRHGASSRAERAILFLYWLISGYGLRASRALAALLVTIVVFAALFEAWGFVDDESYSGALLFSLESTTSLLRGKDQDLTTAGELVWIMLRLLGPVFFGLAILSLRGRVKR